MNRIISHFLLLSIVCTCMNAAEVFPLETVLVEEEALPVSASRPGSLAILAAEQKSIRRSLMLAGCKVAPLPEILDLEALAFENNPESASADVDDLRPNAALALDTLKQMVTSLGGTFSLKSAYRPTAYQTHLHQVWVKWVKELRNNRSNGCRALREEVGAEFARHELLARQQPVPASDHALGLAFDGAVSMPRAARLNGKRVTLDKLAALAGTIRPDRRRDPVHFKLLPDRQVSAGYSQVPSF